jgi:hypothetical protein
MLLIILKEVSRVGHDLLLANKAFKDSFSFLLGVDDGDDDDGDLLWMLLGVEGVKTDGVDALDVSSNRAAF